MPINSGAEDVEDECLDITKGFRCRHDSWHFNLFASKMRLKGEAAVHEERLRPSVGSGNLEGLVTAA